MGTPSSIPGWRFTLAVCDAQPTRRCCVRPATLLPYPAPAGRRPVALRPTLSDGLPLSCLSLSCILSRRHVSKDVPDSSRLLRSFCNDLTGKGIYCERIGPKRLVRKLCTEHRGIREFTCMAKTADGLPYAAAAELQVLFQRVDWRRDEVPAGSRIRHLSGTELRRRLAERFPAGSPFLKWPQSSSAATCRASARDLPFSPVFPAPANRPSPRC